VTRRTNEMSYFSRD